MLWMDRRSRTRTEGERTGEGYFCVCEGAPYLCGQWLSKGEFAEGWNW